MYIYIYIFRTVNVRRYYVYTMFIQYHFLHRQINFLHTHAMKHTYSKYINRRSRVNFDGLLLNLYPLECSLDALSDFV